MDLHDSASPGNMANSLDANGGSSSGAFATQVSQFSETGSRDMFEGAKDLCRLCLKPLASRFGDLGYKN